MNKEINFMDNEKMTGDAVIKRGYAIYDEWLEKKPSSKKIVESVDSAVIAVKQNRTKAATALALSFLFALELRVSEKYDSFWKCLLFYFSWRRETSALKRYKNTLHIADGVDIRIAIEIELQRISEKLENEESDDDDDETHGGKRNSKAEEEAPAKEESVEEQIPEEKTEEIAEKEELNEASEEKTQESTEQAPIEEQIAESEERQQSVEPVSEALEEAVQEDKELLKEEKTNELKEENNVLDEESEPINDKLKEAKAYNEAVDSPPFYEAETRDQLDKKTSFIDEVIIDNMIKGKEDFIRHNPVEDVKQNKEANRPQDTVAHQNEENKEIDKDAYLYDKMLATDKGGTQQTEKIESTQQTEKAAQIKTEQPKEQIQNNEKTEPAEQEFKPLSEMLEADTNPFSENNVIKELNNTISKESGEAIYQAQAEAMREQLTIASEELGIDAPVEIIGRPEVAPLQQSVAGPNRK